MPPLVLAEQLGKADHRVERCAELMADIGEKFGLHPPASCVSMRAVLSASQAFWRSMEPASVAEGTRRSHGPLLAEPTAPPIMHAKPNFLRRTVRVKD